MPPLWQGLCVFVVPERWAVPLSEPVAGIARGMEVLEILPLNAASRTAVARRLGSHRRFPADSGAPLTQFLQVGGEWLPTSTEVHATERPPMSELASESMSQRVRVAPTERSEGVR